MKLQQYLALTFSIAALIGSQTNLLAAGEQQAPVIEVKSKASLIHLGSLDSFDITTGGTQAARLVLEFLEKGNRNAADRAIKIYKTIIPDENFGGEYTAFLWLLECELATEKERQEGYLGNPLVKSFHDFLAREEWKYLREFIRDKYHLDEVPGAKQDPDLKRRSRFMEDFILFANPHRESWEKSSKMIAAVDLKPGEKVADIGSGPGYFSFEFARLVGPEGGVYALDTNVDHVAYLYDTIRKLQIPNVVPVLPQGDLGVPEKVDVIYMCSLYHNLYAVMSEEERVSMIGEIKSILKPDGRFILADNGPVEGHLPYHGPYISREFIIDQFKYFGFELVATHQFIPQRYMLVFKLRPDAPKPDEKLPPAPKLEIPDGGLVVTDLKKLPATPGIAELADGAPDRIRVLSHRSLLRSVIPGLSPTYSKSGRAAARILLSGLKTMNVAQLQAAHQAYAALIPRERTGDECSALDWFCQYALASESERAGMVKGPLMEDYVQFFAANKFERLISYLRNKYVLEELEGQISELMKQQSARLKELGIAETNRESTSSSSGHGVTATGNVNKGGAARGTTSGEPASDDLDEPPPPYQSLKLDIDTDTLIDWWEYMTFLNPRREEWEKSGKMLHYLDVKPGQVIADVGSGAGYYSFKFADLVGKDGKVYALDMAQDQLQNLERAAAKAGVRNIETLVSKENDCKLPENSIDMAYLCSLYHATYVNSIEYVKDGFINSLRKALKPGGKLVVVDNMPLSDKAGGYYGPRIAKELIIAQLTHYGFRFSSYAQFVPQRYMLVFDVDKSDAK